MTSLKERVPKPLRTPVGIMSYGLGLVGITAGYILTMLGIILYYDLALDEQIASPESLIVLAFGIAAFVAGYLGVKGFMYFSY